MQVEIVGLVGSLCLLHIASDPAALLPPVLGKHQAALDLPRTDRLPTKGVRTGIATSLLLVAGITVGGDMDRLEVGGVATGWVFLVVIAALLLKAI